MALTPTVVPGEIIESVWGNEIRDRTIQVFATTAEMTAWAAPEMSFAVPQDSILLYHRAAGAWGRVHVNALYSGAAIDAIGSIGTQAHVNAVGNVSAQGNVYGTAVQSNLGNFFSGTTMAAWQTLDGARATLTLQSAQFRLSTSGPVWNTRPMLIEAPLSALAMHSQSYTAAGTMQFFTSPTHGMGFHFVNGDNTGYYSTHAAAFTVVSKRDAKTEIQPWSQDGLAIINQLQPVTYKAVVEDDLDGNPRTDLQTMVGFIAEDVEPILPEVVTKDVETGEVEGIMYHGIVPVLVDAIKQLTTRLATLETQVAALGGTPAA